MNPNISLVRGSYPVLHDGFIRVSDPEYELGATVEIKSREYHIIRCNMHSILLDRPLHCALKNKDIVVLT